MQYLTRLSLICLLAAIMGASCDCTEDLNGDGGDPSGEGEGESYPPGGGPLDAETLNDNGEVPDGLAETSAAETDMLADLVGYADVTRGGADGWVFHVNSLADTGPGTLREALEKVYPLWIVFDVNGTIDLAAPLSVPADKTIDGRDADITIDGDALLVEGNNVILENITISGGLNIEGLDAYGIWLNHVDIAPNGAAAGMRIAGGATDITISRTTFVDHTTALIIGAGTSPEELADNNDTRVTMFRNFFGLNAKPILVHGTHVHAFNNWIQAWEDWGVGVRYDGGLFSQANVFEAGGDSTDLATDFYAGDEPGYLRSENNWFIGDGATVERYPANVLEPVNFYIYTYVIGGGDIRDQLMVDILQEAGVQ